MRREFHPILLVNISPLAEQDRKTLWLLVADLVRAGPTVSATPNEPGLILSGEDEGHLEAVCDRIRNSRLASVGPIRVRYRETISQPSEAEAKYIRQTGGRGNYGHCRLRLEPIESTIEFATEIRGGAVPDRFFAPVESGIREAAKGGILAGSEVDGFRATLIGGSYHETDSNDVAFSIAASLAFKEAAKKAKPVLLEPIMSVRVVAPRQFAAGITGEIARRRGRTLAVDESEDDCVLSALLPLAETLTSSRYGRFSHPMRFAGYEVKGAEDGYDDPHSAVPAV